MRYVFLAQLFYLLVRLQVRSPFKKKLTLTLPQAQILLASALLSARLSREEALSWVS